MSQPELLQVVEPDLDSVTDETLHMIIALEDFGLRPSLEMSQVICRRLIRAERQVADLTRERDEARAAYRSLIMEETSAEARGYKRGVREAAALAKDFGLPVSDELNAVMTYRQKNIAVAILALLEPVTLQKPEA
jgi:hypothetical protein